MNQQNFLDLIKASQTTIKQDLLTRHPESKYALLMLMRSFDLVREHIVKHENYHQCYRTALTDYFRLPIDHVEEGIKTLCAEIRQDSNTNPEQLLTTLRALNEADLSISHPKVLKNG